MTRFLGLGSRRKMNGFLVGTIVMSILGVALIYGSGAFLDSHALFMGIASADETNMLIFNNPDAKFGIEPNQLLQIKDNDHIGINGNDDMGAFHITEDKSSGFTDLTKAVRLLLEDAVDRSEPDRFEVGFRSIDPGFALYVEPEPWQYDYRIRQADGEWKSFEKDEYLRLLGLEKSKQKQRIAGMKALLRKLEANETPTLRFD